MLYGIHLYSMLMVYNWSVMYVVLKINGNLVL